MQRDTPPHDKRWLYVFMRLAAAYICDHAGVHLPVGRALVVDVQISSMGAVLIGRDRQKIRSRAVFIPRRFSEIHHVVVGQYLVFGLRDLFLAKSLAHSALRQTRAVALMHGYTAAHVGKRKNRAPIPP